MTFQHPDESTVSVNMKILNALVEDKIATKDRTWGAKKRPAQCDGASGANDGDATYLLDKLEECEDGA